MDQALQHVEPSTPLRQAIHGSRRRDIPLGCVLVAPAILMLLAIIIAPLIYSFVLSFFSWRLTEIFTAKQFVFLDNYRAMLSDPVVWIALKNTLVYVLITVTAELLLGFLIALLLTSIVTGRQLLSAVILLPMIITPVIVALIWRYMYDPQFGIINYVLRLLGVSQDIGWLSGQNTALLSIALVDIWEMTPFVILVLHAGMLTISPEMVEAARVDGANYWQTVLDVIMPTLRPLILLVVIIRTMDSLRIFDLIYVLTKGGPETATESMALYTYRTGFIYFDMGYAMALSVLIIGLVVVVSLSYLRLLNQARSAATGNAP